MSKKIVIVGGVAGGASTATRLRRLSEEYEIIMFEKGPYPSFANCGLPYHIGNIIPERESLIVQTPEKFKNRFRVDVRTFSEVVGVNTAEKKVQVQTQDEDFYEESYDVLVLSPGAKAWKAEIEGIDSHNIFSLKTIPDMDKIIAKLKNKVCKRVAIIGGGFIGIEAAENIKHLGIETILIEAGDHILAPFDSEFSENLEEEMREQGVDLYLKQRVVKFQVGKELSVFLENGEIVEVDFVIMAMGVRPDTAFLKNSGITLGKRGEILVNEYLETNIPDVYALGDAIPGVALAGPANRQGRIVANNIFGKREKYCGSIGSSIIKVFDIVGAATGKNEKQLKVEGMEYETVHLYPNSHAGYYPNATQLHAKILFEKESGILLGAQCIGYEGVDKFIDVMATSVHFKGTIYDLSELELCYAPPFGSAKSPVNMAGFIGRNIEDHLMETVSKEEMEDFNIQKHFRLDLRNPEESSIALAECEASIPLDELRDHLEELPKEKEIWCYCAVGLRGYIATRILMQHGFRVKNILGGYRLLPKDWKIENSKEETSNIEKKEEETLYQKKEMEVLNVTGLSCPGPLMKLKSKMESMEEGKDLHIIASDPAFANDVQAWVKASGNHLYEVKKEKGFVHAYLSKKESGLVHSSDTKVMETKEGMTIVVFSGDYDKAMAAFVIANGALAMGKRVTMFFTFWGLSILKKENPIVVKKSFIDRLFSVCLPKSWKNLPLSKMNFGGLGAKMMQVIMKRKNIESLDSLIQNARENGVHIIACTMSMDAMGIVKEELLDGIDFGGVAQYLGNANEGNPNLFI